MDGYPSSIVTTRDAAIDVAFAAGKIAEACRVAVSAMRELRAIVAELAPDSAARLGAVEAALESAELRFSDSFGDLAALLEAMGRPPE